MIRFQKALLSLIILCCTVNVHAQSSDIFRLDYLRIPQNDSGIETVRYKFLVNVPIKLNEDNYLVAGAEYNLFSIDYNIDFPFDTDEINSLNIIDVNLGYITKWNENWRFIAIATPRLASNLDEGPTGRDFFFNATATFLKDRPDADKPFRLALGFSFNSTTGLPIPLPLISYFKKFHPKWSYVLGIPRTSFRYHLDQKQFIQVSLLLDGYFINIQDDIVLDDGQVASRISLSALVGALGYQYQIAKRISLYATGGHTIFQQGILRDNNRRTVFTLNNKSSFYLRAGFKISIF